MVIVGVRYGHRRKPQRCPCDDGLEKNVYAVITNVPNKTPVLVSSSKMSNLKPLAIRVKTLTYDNGKEFAGHSLSGQELNSTAYFAMPFASWELGSNEILNGLLRQ